MDRVRVQIVDDHFLFAQSLASLVAALEGVRVVAISVTGPQALAIAREELPDVVLLDYHLPGDAADELIPRMRAAAPDARIIVLTSDTSAETRERALAAGAHGFMTKDEALDDVVDALQEVAASAVPAGTVDAPPARAPAAEAPPAPTRRAPPSEAVAPGMVRIDLGPASFAEAALVERELEQSGLVERAYVAALADGRADLRARPREGLTAADLAAQLAEGAGVAVSIADERTLRIELTGPAAGA